MVVRRAAASRHQAGRSSQLDLRRLSRSELKRMAAAGREVAECEAVSAKTGDTVVGELLRHQPFFEWDHYPAGEVFDPETQALIITTRIPPSSATSTNTGTSIPL